MLKWLRFVGYIIVLGLAVMVYFSYDLMKEAEESVMADVDYMDLEIRALQQAKWYSKTVEGREQFSDLGTFQKIVNSQAVFQGIEGQKFFRGYRLLTQFDDMHCLNIKLEYPENQPKIVSLNLTDTPISSCVN